MAKKIISSILVAMLFASSANAATIKIKDALNDEITIEGKAADNTVVSVTILNEGFELSDITDPQKKALQFYGFTTAKDGKYSIDVKLLDHSGNENGGGVYRILVNDPDANDPVDYEFYFSTKKNEQMAKINKISPEVYGEYLHDVLKVFSLEMAEIENVPDGDIIEFIEKSKDDEGVVSEDVDEFYKKVKKSLCLAAFNYGESSLFKEDNIAFDDVLELTDTVYYSDYFSGLNDNGRTAVNSAITGKNYQDTQKITDDFIESVALNLVVNNATLGYGHVEDVIDRYDTIFAKYNIYTSKINKLTNKNSVYSSLASSGAKTITELYDIVAKASKPSNTSSGSGGGMGGSGGRIPSVPSSDSQSANEYIKPENTPQKPEDKPAVKLPFDDIGNFDWAKDYISELYSEGVVNGKSETKFDPAAFTTRGEFTKIAYKAFFGEPAESECKFADVNDFSKNYVAAANAMGLIMGKDEKSFYPSSQMTREEASVVLFRIIEKYGIELKMNDEAFDDDSEISEWGKKAVYTLKEAGIISGRGDGKFYPKDSLNRAEAAKLVCEIRKLVKANEK